MTSFPFATLPSKTFNDPLPDACDLVIIGGGVIGIATAIFAADHGLKVVVCEKGRVAAEQSSRNWGWVRQQGRDLGELPISMEARRHWEAFDRELGGDVLGLRWTGILKAAARESELAAYETWLGHARPYGVDSRMVSRAEIADLMPGAGQGRIGGLLTPSDGRAEPWVAVPALARLAQKRGVVIREDCAVRALDLQAGSVTAVETEAGRIGCEQVVVAAGAWSRLLLGAHGVKIPQLSVLNSVQLIEPVSGLYGGGLWDNGYCLRTRADGRVVLTPGSEFEVFVGPDAFASFGHYWTALKENITSAKLHPYGPKGFPDAWGTKRRWQGESPFEAMRILSPAPNQKALAKTRAAFAAANPQVGAVTVSATWAGMIDTLPDGVPIVDRVPKVSGLVVATGMCGHGFGIGPAFGRVIADLLTDRPVGHDLSRFRFKRFSDGSPIDMGHGL